MSHDNLRLSSALCQVEKKDNYEKKSDGEKRQLPDPLMSEGFI